MNTNIFSFLIFQRVDYLIQCVAATVSLLLETTVCNNAGAEREKGCETTGIDDGRERHSDGAGPSNQSTRSWRENGGGESTAVSHQLEVNLCAVLSGLQTHFPHLPQCIREDFLVMLSKVLNSPNQLEKIPGIFMTDL